MSAEERAVPLQGHAPTSVDAALRNTMELLELVRREEQMLARLSRCVIELEAIARARSALADRTDAEVTEARRHLQAQEAVGFLLESEEQR